MRSQRSPRWAHYTSAKRNPKPLSCNHSFVEAGRSWGASRASRCGQSGRRRILWTSGSAPSAKFGFSVYVVALGMHNVDELAECGGRNLPSVSRAADLSGSRRPTRPDHHEVRWVSCKLSFVRLQYFGDGVRLDVDTGA